MEPEALTRALDLSMTVGAVLAVSTLMELALEVVVLGAPLVATSVVFTLSMTVVIACSVHGFETRAAAAPTVAESVAQVRARRQQALNDANADAVVGAATEIVSAAVPVPPPAAPSRPTYEGHGGVHASAA